MERQRPSDAGVDRRLRKRYDEVWQDVRRELAKHSGQQFEQLMQGPGDPEDAATADLLVDLNLAEIDRDVTELRAIQHALGRLQRGQYGICQACGNEIDPARLDALPYAVLCLPCQEKAERSRVSTPSL